MSDTSSNLITFDFILGFSTARREIASGEIYDIDMAMYCFALDPADSDFQRGYERGLTSYKQKGSTKWTDMYA